MLSTKASHAAPAAARAGLQHGLSIFIPIYNEEDILESNLRRVVQYLEAMQVEFEVIVGSNGSTDRSVQIGQAAAQQDSRVVFFHLPQRGPGLAFVEAIRRARFDCMLTLDADLSFDMSFIPRAWEGLEQHEAIVGTKGTAQKRAWFRVLASDAFIWFTNLLLGLPYRDYAIGAKAYRTESIRPYVGEIDRHTFYTQQLLFRLAGAARPIQAVSVRCEDHRASRFNLLHEGFYRYGMLLALWYRTRLRPPR